MTHSRHGRPAVAAMTAMTCYSPMIHPWVGVSAMKRREFITLLDSALAWPLRHGQTLQSIHTDGSRRCLTWTSLSPTAVLLWLGMQRTNPFARLSLAQFLTLGLFSKG